MPFPILKHGSFFTKLMPARLWSISARSPFTRILSWHVMTFPSGMVFPYMLVPLAIISLYARSQSSLLTEAASPVAITVPFCRFSSRMAGLPFTLASIPHSITFPSFVLAHMERPFSSIPEYASSQSSLLIFQPPDSSTHSLSPRPVSMMAFFPLTRTSALHDTLWPSARFFSARMIPLPIISELSFSSNSRLISA